MISNVGTTGTELIGAYVAASCLARAMLAGKSCAPRTPRAPLPGCP
jgi:hypothetical protein